MISKGNHVEFVRFVRLAVSENAKKWLQFSFVQCIIKQLLDSVFVISRIIKVSVRVISLSLRLRLIILTLTLIIWISQKPHPIIVVSIYTHSDLGVLSNPIGSLSLANEHYSPPTEWIMRKPNKNKMAGVKAWIERSIKSIFNGFLLKMLLRSLPVYILKQLFFSVSVNSGRIFTSISKNNC